MMWRGVGEDETNLVLDFLKHFLTIKELLGHIKQNQIKYQVKISKKIFPHYQLNNKATSMLSS